MFNENVLDDFEMLEKLEQMENGNVVAMVGFAKAIFGDEQLENIKTQIRGEDGICKLSDMSDFIGECMQAAATAKRVDIKN